MTVYKWDFDVLKRADEEYLVVDYVTGYLKSDSLGLDADYYVYAPFAGTYHRSQLSAWTALASALKTARDFFGD